MAFNERVAHNTKTERKTHGMLHRPQSLTLIIPQLEVRDAAEKTSINAPLVDLVRINISLNQILSPGIHLSEANVLLVMEL